MGHALVFRISDATDRALQDLKVAIYRRDQVKNPACKKLYIVEIVHLAVNLALEHDTTGFAEETWSADEAEARLQCLCYPCSESAVQIDDRTKYKMVLRLPPWQRTVILMRGVELLKATVREFLPK